MATKELWTEYNGKGFSAEHASYAERATKDEDGNDITLTYATNVAAATKADKVLSAVNNNVASLDATGNLKDSGIATSVLTSWVDASYTIPPETITIGGRAYRIVTIGNQQWMAENLDYTWSGLTVDPYGVGSYNIQRKTNYYDNNPTLYSQYGRMYDWYAADHLNSNLATIIGSRLASDGWHVPSPTDFDTLVTYAGGSSTAGTKLKATSGWSGRGGTDNYGFTWLPGGLTENSGGQIAYYRGGQWGFIWAISASSSSSTVYPYAAYFDNAGCDTRSMNKGDEVSIRLVRNLT